MGRREDRERFEYDSLYMVAVMKIGHDLRKIKSEGFETLLDQVLAELGVDYGSFERYLDSHREDLERTVETVGI